MKSPINFCNGKIIHQRFGKIKHKFINLHLFLLINISKIKNCDVSSNYSNVSLLSINRFNILSWHIKDHGDRKNCKIEKLNEFLRNCFRFFSQKLIDLFSKKLHVSISRWVRSM